MSNVPSRKYRFSYTETVTTQKSIDVCLDDAQDPEMFADQLWFLRNCIRWNERIEPNSIERDVDIYIQHTEI